MGAGKPTPYLTALSMDEGVTNPDRTIMSVEMAQASDLAEAREQLRRHVDPEEAPCLAEGVEPCPLPVIECEQGSAGPRRRSPQQAAHDVLVHPVVDQSSI